MPSFNTIILAGHLTRDPELKYLPNQTPVAQFGIAVNHAYKSNGERKEDVLFIDCACFGKQAETINQYLTKGRAVLIEGRLKLDTWEDKKDGKKRSKHSVIVNRFTFLGKNEGDDSDQRRAQGRSAPESPFDDSQQFKDEDIPF